MPLIARLGLSVLVASTLCTGPLWAQASDPERWQIQREDGEYLWDLRLGEVRGESLVVRQGDSMLTVPITSIRELRLVRKTTLRLADGVAGAGAYAALTGGSDEVYDLGALEFAARLQALREILSRHPSQL